MPTVSDVTDTDDTDPLSSSEVEGLALPVLLRIGLGVYGQVIRSRLAGAGFADLPRNGAFVLGRVSRGSGSGGLITGELGVSKQATSQLLNTLVIRGYLSRQSDPQDRRRLNIHLTARGCAAAAVILAGIKDVDQALAATVTAAEIACLRTALNGLQALQPNDIPEMPR